MSYSVSQLKSEVVAMLHTTSPARITNFNGAIYRAARQVLQDVDPLETVRLISMDAPISQDVYEYMCPADLKADRVVDIRPTGNRPPSATYNQGYSEAFDRNKQQGRQSNPFTIQWKNGVKTIRINTSLGTAPVNVNPLESLTQNGAWAGTITNLVQDGVFFVGDQYSIRGTLPSALTSAYIENSTMTAADLSDYVSTGYITLNAFVTDASKIASIEVRLGSGDTNYYVGSATQTAESTPFQNGWNLIRIAFNDCAQVGGVTASSIVYARITVNYSAIVTDMIVRFNILNASLGIGHEMLYYSKYLFRSPAGTFQEIITSSDDSELINLDTDSYNLLVYQAALQCVQQNIPLDNQNDFQWIGTKYVETKDRYIANVKSQAKRTISSYYDMNQNSSTDLWGTGYSNYN